MLDLLGIEMEDQPRSFCPEVAGCFGELATC